MNKVLESTGSTHAVQNLLPGVKVYLVGGAVRDFIMGRDINDRDYLAITTTDVMTSAGFEPTGKHFPVYRHPGIPGVEVSLPRVESKTGPGHNGFSWRSAALEDDLRRRDLTVNAMALDTDLNIIDPFGGREDIKLKRIRHVSDHFPDDPLRAYRAARFCAQFGSQWHICNNTLNLMQTMRSEIENLSIDRVKVELCKALNSNSPSQFFGALGNSDLLDIHFPEVSALMGVEQPVKHHPEGDAYEHTMDALRYAGGCSEGAVLMTLVHDFGKALTPREQWPAHHDHENRVEPVKEFCKRFLIGRQQTNRLISATQLHMKAHKVYEMRPGSAVDLYLQIRRFSADFIDMVHADENGRGAHHYPNGYTNWSLRNLAHVLNGVKLHDARTPEEVRNKLIDSLRPHMECIRRNEPWNGEISSNEKKNTNIPRADENGSASLTT